MPDKKTSLHYRITVTSICRPRYIYKTRDEFGDPELKKERNRQLDDSALTSTFLKIREKLRGVAAAISGSHEEADDILGETFCRLWASHPAIREEREVARISYAAVRNSAIDSYRRRSSHPSIPLDQTLTDFSTDSDEDGRRETYRALLAISRRVLDKRQMKVFELHDIIGLPYNEISSRLGLSEQNVRQILSRARKKIRQIYRQQYE